MKVAGRLLLLACFVMTLPSSPRAEESDVVFERSELQIETKSGERHRFDIEVARTAQQRARGLMFREELAPDAGMLFINPGDQEIRMWMKNTLIPLDMLFVGADGRILKIVENTVPLSEDIITSGVAARAVIEVNGGTSERLGIEPGDRVRHPVFGD